MKDSLRTWVLFLQTKTEINLATRFKIGFKLLRSFGQFKMKNVIWSNLVLTEAFKKMNAVLLSNRWLFFSKITMLIYFLWQSLPTGWKYPSRTSNKLVWHLTLNHCRSQAYSENQSFWSFKKAKNCLRLILKSVMLHGYKLNLNSKKHAKTGFK